MNERERNIMVDAHQKSDSKNSAKMTTIEASDYLGVHKHTMANWRTQKTGPAYYKPTEKLIYYFKHDLDKWITDSGLKNNG